MKTSTCIHPLLVLAGGHHPGQAGPDRGEVREEARPWLGGVGGHAGTQAPGQHLARHRPVESRLDDGGVRRGDHCHQNVGELQENVQCSSHILLKLEAGEWV